MTQTTKAGDYLGRAIKQGTNDGDFLGRDVLAGDKDFLGRGLAGQYATGATAGIPGSFTPAGATPPTSPAALTAGSPVAVTATPATAWTTGQYVQTGTAGVPGQAHWSGTAWVTGPA
jgi:hypothetical protein